MNAQLEAQKEEDFGTYLEQAIQGFCCEPRNWPTLTQKLYNEVDEFYINTLVQRHWNDSAELGRQIKDHYRDKFYEVWGEMGVDD